MSKLFRSSSEEEAFNEMFGLTQISQVEHPISSSSPPSSSSPLLTCTFSSLPSLTSQFLAQGVLHLPPSIARFSPSILSKATAQLIHAPHLYPLCTSTYETINDAPHLTRLENFVTSHPQFNEICTTLIPLILSKLLGNPWFLYKEKLNFKPPSGKGFAPHLDSPSLRSVASNPSDPSTFITVCLPIDKMTKHNGSLEVIKGLHSDKNHYPLIPPSDDNPDGGGRAGEIDINQSIAEKRDLTWELLECNSGEIIIFNGFVPHRSGTNFSAFDRRAIFLTYNPAEEGDFRSEYYRRMDDVREKWKTKKARLSEDLWLASVPK